MQVEAGGSLLNRMARAVRLDAGLYKEVNADTAAEGQALAAVAVTGLASGLGVGFAAAIVEGGLGFFGRLVIGTLVSLGGWLIWCLYSYWAGTIIFGRPEDRDTYRGMVHRGLIRTMGFAGSPRLLGFLFVIPVAGWLITLAAFVWALVAGVAAVKETLGLSRNQAVAACAAGWIPYTLLVLLITEVTI